MPASLSSLKIRGVRSYSPLENKVQTIDFMPLTLIVGANGNGKTTIIESLKFIISGEEPPLSDSRRNFVHTPKQGAAYGQRLASYASIELEFQSSKNETCVAKRDISRVPAGKNACPSISSAYRIGKRPWNDVHKQDDWNKTLPLLFNLPTQAMLDNVILCHQEQNLWCFADSSSVKQVFDKIFGCEQYKREIKNIDSEIKNCKTEITFAEKDMTSIFRRVEEKRKLISDVSKMENDIQASKSKLNSLDLEVKIQSKTVEDLNVQIQVVQARQSKIDSLNFKSGHLKQELESFLQNLKEPIIDSEQVSDDRIEELVKEQSQFIDDMKVRRNQFSQSRIDLQNKIYSTEKQKSMIEADINHLKVVEMKSKDTFQTLTNHLQKMKLEQSIDDVDPDNVEKSLLALKNFELALESKKSEHAENEDDLSDRLQYLSKAINKLEVNLQGLSHKIKSKEVLRTKLSEQLAQADPIALGMTQVTKNLDDMLKCTPQMQPPNLVKELEQLISTSAKIMTKLSEKFKDESISRLNSEINKGNTEIQLAETEISKLQCEKETKSQERQKLEAEHSVARVASKEAHNKMVHYKNLHKTVVDTFHRYKTEVELLNSKNMRSVVEQLQDIDTKLADLRQKLADLSQQESILSEECEKSLLKLSELQKNQKLRQLKAKVNSIESEISVIKDENKLISPDDYQSLNQQREEAEKKLSGLKDQRSMIAGKKSLMDTQLSEMRHRLRIFPRVYCEYAESLGELVCNQIMMSDLEKLKACFQSSIIDFHNQMIAKINEVLRVRWKQIYKGSDIDLIELVDEEITKGKDKKSFNYYIAMRKGNVKMKMREKSSAGQKALASIILRMTLAELFVKDFAFIALDEPTANLDIANVQSLAKAIGNYVRRRKRKGMNIQWIIITHDENFLRALDEECSPFFYRVQLDQDGCSQIVKISFNDFRASQIEGSR